jgi:hypothetical protein
MRSLDQRGHFRHPDEIGAFRFVTILTCCAIVFALGFGFGRACELEQRNPHTERTQ